ncbi:MAG: C_GCAxxG_C_C family protein [Bacteroidaceae bacterium]|nr:C_GCAxxG_C_C family protein [Bacteroidaceae bacterium]MBR1520667.1 C_GCAxxG_C_C family protein [Bacteroidaceae bacterium]
MNTEERVQKAVAYFKQGYNCSQSVVLAFADHYGLDESFAAHISASFGGGIGRMRETCGTACGMFMLAGLEVGGNYPDQELKKRNYEVVQRLAADFRAQTGSLLCKELLGLNKQRADGTIPEIQIVATPEARTDEYYKKRPCVRMVETATRIYCHYLESLKNPENPQTL